MPKTLKKSEKSKIKLSFLNLVTNECYFVIDKLFSRRLEKKS